MVVVTSCPTVTTVIMIIISCFSPPPLPPPSVVWFSRALSLLPLSLSVRLLPSILTEPYTIYRPSTFYLKEYKSYLGKQEGFEGKQVVYELRQCWDLPCVRREKLLGQ